MQEIDVIHTYIATVQLVIEAANEDEALDIVNSVLSDYGTMGEELKDWDYLKVGRHLLSPARDYNIPSGAK